MNPLPLMDRGIPFASNCDSPDCLKAAIALAQTTDVAPPTPHAVYKMSIAATSFRYADLGLSVIPVGQDIAHASGRIASDSSTVLRHSGTQRHGTFFPWLPTVTHPNTPPMARCGDMWPMGWWRSVRANLES